MKIDNITSTTQTLPTGESRTAKTGGKPADGAGSSAVVGGDLVSRLNAMKSDSSDMTVNRARVEEIKQAIASGSITIKPENIADGLLDSVIKMLGSDK